MDGINFSDSDSIDGANCFTNETDVTSSLKLIKKDADDELIFNSIERKQKCRSSFVCEEIRGFMIGFGFRFHPQGAGQVPPGRGNFLYVWPLRYSLLRFCLFSFRLNMLWFSTS